MGASGVKRLCKLGMIKDAPGMAALDMNKGERSRPWCHSALPSAYQGKAPGQWLHAAPHTWKPRAPAAAHCGAGQACAQEHTGLVPGPTTH